MIKEAALKFWKNPVFILPILFQGLASLLLVMLFLLVLAAIFGVSFLSEIDSIVNSAQSITQTIPQILSQNIALLIALGILLLLSIIAAASFFEGSLLGMINSKKPGFREFRSGKKFFSRIFSFNLLLAAIVILIAAIIFVLALLAVKWAALIVFIILLTLAFMIFLLFFTLSPFYIVIDNAGIKNSIRKSFRIVKKNFWGLVLLLILTSLICMILRIIPRIGYFLSMLLGSTYQRICVNMFAVSKAK